MSDKETKATIKNFTPLLDELVKQHGVITAAVWGRIWRYAQQDNKVCQASLEKIANELGINRRTVIRHIEILVQNKYLKDHSPDLRNRPHTYSITSKARILITIEGVTESHTNEEKGVTLSPDGVTLSPDRSDLKSLEETIKETNKKQYISDGEKIFLDAFGGKRLNQIQKNKINGFVSQFGIDNFTAGVEWAATQGMTMGHAIISLEKALPKWGKPKAGAKVTVNDDGSYYG